ncbi:hypothetical protein FB107DRAFT_201036 [Schizophyllum commune]
MPKMPGPSRTQSKRRYTPDTLPGFTCKRCDDCGRRVVSRPDQQRHANLHLPPEYDNIKYPHACDWPKCTQRFSQATALQDHINVHTGARPHKCPECSKGFANAGNLHHHRRRAHQYKSDKTRGRRESPRAAPYTKRRKGEKVARTPSPSVSDRSEDVHDSQDSPLPADAPATASGFAAAYAPEISPAASFSSSFAGPSSQPSPADAVFLWTTGNDSDNNRACVPVAGPSRFNAPSPAATSYACDAFLPVGASYPFFGQNLNDFSNVPAQQSDDGLMFTPPQRNFNLPLDDPTLPLDRSKPPFDTFAFSLDSTLPSDTPTFPLDAFGAPADSFGFDSSLYPLDASLPPLNDPFFPLEARASGSYDGQTTYNGQILFDGHPFGSFNDRTPYTTSLPQPPANFAHDSLEEDARHTFARLRFTHP